MTVAVTDVDPSERRDPQADRRGLVHAVVLVVLALAAGVLAFAIGRHGAVYASDSAVYLGVAHNLLHGHGLTSPVTLAFTDGFSPLRQLAFDGAIPVTTLPPGYSILLAVPAAFGVDLGSAAVGVGAVSLAAGVYLLGRIAERLTAGAIWVSVGVVALFVFGGPLAQGYYPASYPLLSAYALSEVPFLVFVLLTLLTASRFAETGDRRALWLSAAVVGASILCRFLGVFLVPVVAASLLFRRDRWATRVRLLAGVGALSLGPVLVWLVALRALVGSGASATPLRIRPLPAHLLRELVDNVSRWFVPRWVGDDAAVAIVVVGFAAVVAMAVYLFRRGRRPDTTDPPLVTEPLFLLALVAIVAYGVVLFASIWLTNSNISFDARLLAPVRTIVYVLVAAIVYRFAVAVGLTRADVVVFAGLLLVSAPWARSTVDLARDGATQSNVATLAVLDGVRRLPRDAPVMSNGPDSLWLGADRASILAPVKFVPEAGVANPSYRSDLREARALLRRPGTYLVMIRGVGDRVIASARELAGDRPLEVVARYPDGTIYRVAAP